MANSFCKRITFLFFLTFIFCLTEIYAQESGRTFSQKLEWKSDSAAFEYKVEIRNLATGKVTEFKTEQTQIEFSFPSGDYEWRVTAYDFLGRESTKTNWVKFTIKKAIEPKIKRKEREVTAYISKQFSIPVEAEKVEPDAKVELINSRTNKSISGKIDGESAIFEKTSEGDYKIRVTNPGGLYSETEPIKLISQERLDEERRIEEERLAEERRREEERLAEEKRREEERLAEEKRLEEERLAEEKRLEEERLAEEKRLEEERIAEEKRLEEERLAEERRLEEERLAEEKRLEEERLAEEAARKKKDIFVMMGAYYPIMLSKSEMVNNRKDLVGADLKFEIFPVKFDTLMLGINLETNPLPLLSTYKDSAGVKFSDEYLFFIPFNLNLSLYMPIIKGKLLFGAQVGGGGIGILQIEKYANENYTEYSNYTRPDSNEFYMNFMFDAGIGLRFIIGKHFAIDFKGEFEFWRMGNQNVMNVMIGPQIGVKF